MIKLYKQIKQELNYWQTWEHDEKKAIIYWGIVGQYGQQKEIKSSFFSNFRKIIQKEIDKKLGEGFAKLDENETSFLEIEYIIDGFGTEEDIDKRHTLEERLDELLILKGLGDTNGGSIGSGTMEVGCSVVNFEIAKKSIEENLKDTEFGNYSRIFQIR